MRKLAAGLAATAALALMASTPGPAAAHGGKAPQPLGEKSLAEVLLSDRNQFDRNGRDYDIVTEAALAVLQAKPGSKVKVLTDGSTPLTAFLPNDRAFAKLARSIPGQHPRTEAEVFAAVAGLGIDTVETVLLYHVVPGATVTFKQALRSDGAHLTTAQGGQIQVSARGNRWHGSVRLIDKDPDSRNPRVNRPDVNKGNKQIAHGVDRVLRPVDLPF
jgi:uncharacterized surface protein with fasciclin (FAS1) repeats